MHRPSGWAGECWNLGGEGGVVPGGRLRAAIAFRRPAGVRSVRRSRSAPFGTAGNAACGAVHGRFTLDTDPPRWLCVIDPNTETGAIPILAAACNTDTGNSGTFLTELLDNDNAAAVCTA